MPSRKTKSIPAQTESVNVPELQTDERTITIDLPLSIANDRAKMGKVLDNVLDHLGCRTCHSGWDLRFRHIRDLTINPKTLEVSVRGSIIEK